MVPIWFLNTRGTDHVGAWLEGTRAVFFGILCTVSSFSYNGDAFLPLSIGLPSRRMWHSAAFISGVESAVLICVVANHFSNPQEHICPPTLTIISMMYVSLHEARADPWVSDPPPIMCCLRWGGGCLVVWAQGNAPPGVAVGRLVWEDVRSVRWSRSGHLPFIPVQVSRNNPHSPNTLPK